jgi:hypothetical protein
VISSLSWHVVEAACSRDGLNRIEGFAKLGWVGWICCLGWFNRF